MISKLAVRDWLDTAVERRRKVIQKHIDDTIGAFLDPVLEQVLTTNPTIQILARQASSFVDTMRDAVEQIPYLKDNVRDVTSCIRDVENYGVDLLTRMRNSLRVAATNHIKEPHKNAYTLPKANNSQELVDTVDTLVDLLKPEYKKLTDLNTLKSELNQAITNETSGKRAYRALIAAGVDMAGFEEEQKVKGNLPMVVKLSADVCLLNNNCG